MTEPETVPAALKIIYGALPRARRRQGFITLVLMLAGAVAEMITISAVFGFLLLLTDPDRLTTTQAWAFVQSWSGQGANPFVVVTTGFAFVIAVTGGIRIALSWQAQSFSVHTAVDLSATAFRKVTSQQYRFYLDHGSDQILSRFDRLYLINNAVLAGAQAIVASFLSAVIIGFLLLLDAATAITLAVVLIGLYMAFSRSTVSTLNRNSQIIASTHSARVRRIQQAIGGIRDILIDRSQRVFQADYEQLGDSTRRPQVFNAVIATTPRIVIEIVAMIAIALLALIISQKQGGLLSAIPTLGGLAMGAQRLMPLLQQAYYGWSYLAGSRETILQVAGLLGLDESPPPPIARPSWQFESAMKFDRVSFSYMSGQPILEEVSFSIQRGDRIGIVGKTGSGKSTLMDLLLGLLAPTAGVIKVDGKQLDSKIMPAWQAQIAHVPQSIYLSDDSLAGNIAFGVAVGQIDAERLEWSARSAGIHDFIESLPEGYATRCGERGIRLSGGQRQRLGVARALYKRARILVLDEATSALDSATEQAVIASITELAAEVTVIMVAHRLSTLAECNRILRVEAGRVTEMPLSSLNDGVAQAH